MEFSSWHLDIFGQQGVGELMGECIALIGRRVVDERCISHAS